jgi:hypothetical protein
MFVLVTAGKNAADAVGLLNVFTIAEPPPSGDRPWRYDKY